MTSAMITSPTELSFAPRFCGPPGTVNGGVACGTLAELSGAAEVTLRHPVPVGTSLTVHLGDGPGGTLHDGGTLLAEARPATADGVSEDVPAPPAEAAAGRADYFADPLFPGCFVCGTDRAPGDGLRIFPGRGADAPVWAARWTPDPSVTAGDGRVRPEVVWAALDCPSGIAAGEAAALPAGTTALLGRMTARVRARPRPGEACRVVAWPVGRDGRKLTAASALLDADGAVLAAARTLWITVPAPAHRLTAGAAS